MRFAVTPYAGVWIEIVEKIPLGLGLCVTPYAGVWIEIDTLIFLRTLTRSLPTRECGLKSSGFLMELTGDSHSLRGSVD